MASIKVALSTLKHDPAAALDVEAIESACRAAGYVWRQRELDPATTLAMFTQQVIAGNCPCSQVPRLTGRGFSASAYCQARSRLPLSVYQATLKSVQAMVLPLTHAPHAQWLKRHRVVVMDGTSFQMPDTPELLKHFGTPTGRAPGCSYPRAHLLTLFDINSGFLMGQVASPFNTADLTVAHQLHDRLQQGDVVLGDDPYCTFGHIATLAAQGVHAVFPSYHSRIVSFKLNRPHREERKRHQRPLSPEFAAARAAMPTSRYVRRLGHCDQLVEWFKPARKPTWMTAEQNAALPESIIVREVRRTVYPPGRPPIVLTVVTTLLDPKLYPAHEIVKLRVRRWEVETNLRHIKTTTGLTQLHCKSLDGVMKEMIVFCIVYNLVRRIMLEAARRQLQPVDRISFSDALAWIRHARPGDTLTRLAVNPLRRRRAEPRRIKQRKDRFPPMRKSRAAYRKYIRKHGRKA